MNTSLRSLALCLSVGATMLPLAAHAELSPAQMDAAKLHALSGKMLNLPASCPAVNIPAEIVKNQEAFDKLEKQLKAAQACMIEIRESTMRPDVVLLAKLKNTKASKAQAEELADIMLLAARPTIEKHEAALDRNENEATEAVLAFMRKKDVETSMEEDFDKCDKEEPKEREWKSWVAAEIFLTQYGIFDRCVKALFSTVERMDPSYVVNANFSKESYTTQTYLLKEIPNLQQAMLKKLVARLDAAAPARARAKQFALRDRAADAKASDK